MPSRDQLLCHNPRHSVQARMMTPRELEEYKSLRATIRERGTARLWIFVSGIAAWAAASLATTAITASPVATVVPLLVLAAVFEAGFAIHIGVERLGRYLQGFFQHDAEARKG